MQVESPSPTPVNVVLQPARHLLGNFVANKEPALSLTWAELASLFPQSPLPAETLRGLKVGGFVGVAVKATKLQWFYLHNGGHKGNIGWYTRKNPTFLKSVLRVYRVEHVDRGGEVAEK